MSIKDGPGEGTWSVFAAKVVEERDTLRARVAELEADMMRELLSSEDEAGLTPIGRIVIGQRKQIAQFQLQLADANAVIAYQCPEGYPCGACPRCYDALKAELDAARDDLFDLRNKAGCGPEQAGPDVWAQLTAAQAERDTWRADAEEFEAEATRLREVRLRDLLENAWLAGNARDHDGTLADQANSMRRSVDAIVARYLAPMPEKAEPTYTEEQVREAVFWSWTTGWSQEYDAGTWVGQGAAVVARLKGEK